MSTKVLSIYIRTFVSRSISAACYLPWTTTHLTSSNWKWASKTKSSSIPELLTWKHPPTHSQRRWKSIIILTIIPCRPQYKMWTQLSKVSGHSRTVNRSWSSLSLWFCRMILTGCKINSRKTSHWITHLWMLFHRSSRPRAPTQERKNK